MGRSHSIETMSVPHLVLNRVDWLTQRVVDYQVVCLYSHLIVCLFVHLLVCLTDYEYGHLSVCLRGLLAAYRIVQLDDYLFHPYYPPRVGSNPEERETGSSSQESSTLPERGTPIQSSFPPVNGHSFPHHASPPCSTRRPTVRHAGTDPTAPYGRRVRCVRRACTRRHHRTGP